jgi:predicted nucleic-acid-binding protein
LKIIAGTNILVRAVVRDDERQACAAASLLKDASLIAVTSPTLCEFARVLRRLYRFEPKEIAGAIRALLDAANVAVNRSAAEAGLAMLEAGGDFADGVIAFEGRWLGGETFVSFDRKAVALLRQQGTKARLLSIQ